MYHGCIIFSKWYLIVSLQFSYLITASCKFNEYLLRWEQYQKNLISKEKSILKIGRIVRLLMGQVE